MCYTEHGPTKQHKRIHYSAMVWQHVHNDGCREYRRSGFRTEEAAVKWCEDKVDTLCRGMTTRDAQQFVHQAQWALNKLLDMGCVEGLEILRDTAMTGIVSLRLTRQLPPAPEPRIRIAHEPIPH